MQPNQVVAVSSDSSSENSEPESSESNVNTFTNLNPNTTERQSSQKLKQAKRLELQRNWTLQMKLLQIARKENTIQLDSDSQRSRSREKYPRQPQRKTNESKDSDRKSVSSNSSEVNKIDSLEVSGGYKATLNAKQSVPLEHQVRCAEQSVKQKLARLQQQSKINSSQGNIMSERRKDKLNKRRLDRMFDKKLKEHRVGKDKDRCSNLVFNAIEEYFM